MPASYITLTGMHYGMALVVDASLLCLPDTDKTMIKWTIAN